MKKNKEENNNAKKEKDSASSYNRCDACYSYNGCTIHELKEYEVAINCEFLRNNYTLPVWFPVHDIDWQRYSAFKNGKAIVKENKKSDKDVIKSNELYWRFETFSNYLWYLYRKDIDDDFECARDLTAFEMNDILKIRVCDFDWYFTYYNPVYDMNSSKPILTKMNKNMQILREKYRLPKWIDEYNIDYDDYKPMSNGKEIIKKDCEITVNERDNVTSEELYRTNELFLQFIKYINNEDVADFTKAEMEQMLKIRYCDYDWCNKKCKIFGDDAIQEYLFVERNIQLDLEVNNYVFHEIFDHLEDKSFTEFPTKNGIPIIPCEKIDKYCTVNNADFEEILEICIKDKEKYLKYNKIRSLLMYHHNCLVYSSNDDIDELADLRICDFDWKHDGKLNYNENDKLLKYR